MRRRLLAGLLVATGCYADGAVGATTPVHGPAKDGARNLFAGDLGIGSGAYWPGGGFDLGFSGQRIPAGSERNGFGGFGRILFRLGSGDLLSGTVRLSFSVVPGEDKTDGDFEARSLKLSLGAVAQASDPADDTVAAGGPALSIQWVEVEGLGESVFVGLELSAVVGGNLLGSGDESSGI
jgi:hypothetical protein